MRMLLLSGSRARWATCHLAEGAAAKVRLVHRRAGEGVRARGGGGRARQEEGTGAGSAENHPRERSSGVMQQTAAE